MLENKGALTSSEKEHADTRAAVEGESDEEGQGNRGTREIRVPQRFASTSDSGDEVDTVCLQIMMFRFVTICVIFHVKPFMHLFHTDY